MSCSIEEWKASASGEGEDRVIKVSGDGECTRDGCSARLEPTNEGIVDNPEIAVLSLKVDCPEIGLEVMRPVHVEAEIEGDPATKVEIRTSDGPEMVDVSAA